jgi:hypothetical protein
LKLICLCLGFANYLREWASNQGEKLRPTLSAKKNKPLRLTWAKKHQHFTVDQWRQLVFSEKTRVNLWGSDGNSYYWSNGGDILQLCQTEPHVEGDGGSVFFWGFITANGTVYGTTVMNGSVDSTFYVDILQTSLLNTLEYYDMNCNGIRFQ